eukprot:12911037-Prorocentrum_lima.AAC.1
MGSEVEEEEENCDLEMHERYRSLLGAFAWLLRSRGGHSTFRWLHAVPSAQTEEYTLNTSNSSIAGYAI